MNQPAQHSLRSILPAQWLKSYDYAWLTLYSIALGTEQEFRLAKRVELRDAMIFTFWGSMNYLDASTLTLRFSPNGDLITEGDVSQRELGLGAWLAVIQPCNTNNPSNEYALKVSASVFASLLVSVTTRNYVYSRVFDNCISLIKDEATAATNPVVGPHGFHIPTLSDLDKFERSAKILAKMPQAERRRIELSLQWYDKSVRSFGVDSFLNNWIAIETLAMPDTSNIKPINTMLSKIYDISLELSTERFSVGRLLGLRSRIVHNGMDLVVHSQMSDYMCWLYEDLLHYTLGIESKRLGQIALLPDFRFENLLRAWDGPA